MTISTKQFNFASLKAPCALFDEKNAPAGEKLVNFVLQVGASRAILLAP